MYLFFLLVNENFQCLNYIKKYKKKIYYVHRNLLYAVILFSSSYVEKFTYAEMHLALLLLAYCNDWNLTSTFYPIYICRKTLTHKTSVSPVLQVINLNQT